MKIEHLSKPTLSGEFEELKFDAVGDCEWFKFSPDEREDWVGVFGCGDTGETLSVLSFDNTFALVFSRGKGYALDIASRSLLFKVEDILFQQGGSQIPNTSRVLIFDIDSLYIYDRDGQVWEHIFENVDGIRNLCITADSISGEAYHLYYPNEKWISFTVPY